MYGRCNSMDDARRVFDDMQDRNVVSWNAMIAVYAQNQQGQHALQLFSQMLLEGPKMNKVTFLSIVIVLSGPAALEEGRILHARVVGEGFECDTVVGTALVSMYSKCDSLDDARRIFDRLDPKTVVSWNALIGAYAEHGCSEEALLLFHQMQDLRVEPNKITFINVLSACSSRSHLSQGKEVHARITNAGYDTDVHVGTALLSMYGKCGSLNDAEKVFDRIDQRSIVSWNAMIAVSAELGSFPNISLLVQQMMRAGIIPDKITFINILNACLSADHLEWGKEIHASVIYNGFETDVHVMTALITMYGKCGSLSDAQKVFDEMSQRNFISWNAMIAVYARLGREDEAIQLFHRMQQEGMKPDTSTFLTMLGASSSLPTSELGKMIHECIVKNGLRSDIILGSALVNMYAKSGSLEEARAVFEAILKRDVILWTTMIAAYAQHGDSKEVLQLFPRMMQEGVKPNDVTFLNVLQACTHAGLVHEGCQYFNSMIEDHGITPTAEHYGCMVDLFARAGLLDKAEDFINKMPYQPNAVIWKTLLSACRVHGDIELGHRAAKRVIELDSQLTSPYVLLSNMQAADVRNVMLDG